MKANMISLVTLLVVLAMTIAVPLRSGGVHWTGLRIAGAAVAGTGLLMLIVARLQLGASFSIDAKAKELVTTGLYSKIRNPIYVAGELFLLGVAMVTGKWLLLLLVLALVPVQVVRARKEEQVLTQAFGEEYARYKAGTWF
jgi:protein-S-isoprenylcysteine O-methyltransferase Ste14